MGQTPTKAAGNPYCQARLAAAKYTGRLKSREGASEELGVSPSSVADWELGNTKPTPEKVNLMADIYQCPELRNHYCVNECPLGAYTTFAVERLEFDRLTVEVVSSLHRSDKMLQTLLHIAEDGEISKEEQEQFWSIVDYINTLAQRGQALELWGKKHLKTKEVE